MQLQHSDTLFQNLAEDSSQMRQLTERTVVQAFEALPDAVYLFGSDRRLVHANGVARRLDGGELQKGKACCQAFPRFQGFHRGTKSIARAI